MNGFHKLFRLMCASFSYGGSLLHLRSRARHVISSRAVLMLLLVLPPTAHQATAAGRPRIGFDFPHAVECAEIVPEVSNPNNPAEKMVAANIKISVRLISGEEKDIEQLLVELSSPTERMRIVDFEPNTMLQSDIAGEIRVSRTKEDYRSLGVSTGGGIPTQSGNIVATPSADVSRTRRDVLKEESNKRPAKQVIIASGKIQNEHGVFFKLKASSQSTLEDVHEFRITFSVPHEWRGDWMVVRCGAQLVPGKTKLLPPSLVGQTEVLLGLHSSGDLEARASAIHLSHVQRLPSAVDPLQREQHGWLESWTRHAKKLSSQLQRRVPWFGENVDGVETRNAALTSALERMSEFSGDYGD